MQNNASVKSAPPVTYEKQPLSVAEQIEKLKRRGLIIQDYSFAQKTLSNISYYRLRAYTYPFQDNANPDHPFTQSISLEDIISLLTFDSKLRTLVFSAIEKIEIALRAQLVYHFSLRYGSHWHVNRSLFNEEVDKNGYSKFDNLMENLTHEVNRGHEDFIAHYKRKYAAPAEPPSWMGLETVTFGTLSKFLSNLNGCNEKYEVVRYFGLNNADLFENWIYGINTIRNVCAHHGRLWNRGRLAKIKYPTNPINPFIQQRWGREYSMLYGYLCAIPYLLHSMSATDYGFKESLKTLLSAHPIVDEAKMGFPDGWRADPFWV